MSNFLRVSLAIAVLAALGSCGAETPAPGMAALQQALQQEFPGAQFELRFIDGPYHLEITVDTAVYGNFRLDDAQRRVLGEDMARIAIEYFGAASQVDSISIQFVQERSGGLLSSSWSMMREKYAVADFR